MPTPWAPPPPLPAELGAPLAPWGRLVVATDPHPEIQPRLTTTTAAHARRSDQQLTSKLQNGSPAEVSLTARNLNLLLHFQAFP